MSAKPPGAVYKSEYGIYTWHIKYAIFSLPDYSRPASSISDSEASQISEKRPRRPRRDQTGGRKYSNLRVSPPKEGMGLRVRLHGLTGGATRRSGRERKQIKDSRFGEFVEDSDEMSSDAAGRRPNSRTARKRKIPDESVRYVDRNLSNKAPPPL